MGDCIGVPVSGGASREGYWDKWTSDTSADSGGRVLDVAGSTVMSGIRPCNVPGRSVTLSKSFVETALARFPMACWSSMLGLVTRGEEFPDMDVT